MKRIEAIIRPDKMADINEALVQYAINGMTVSEVIGCGLQKGWTDTNDWQEFNMNLVPKVKLEIVLHDSKVKAMIELLSSKARTGKIGDGKIFVYSIQDVSPICPGDCEKSALESEKV